MRRIGGYLWFVPVAFRAMVQFDRDPYMAFSMWCLVIYGLLLLLGDWLYRQRAMQQAIYLTIQAVLVVAMIYDSGADDFFALLFIPLSLQAVYFFGRRVGFWCIAAFSSAMLFPLLTSENGPIFSLAMTALYGGLGLLFGGYAYAVDRAEAARQQNQRMLVELQAAHHQLQDYSIQLEDLAIERERNRLARELHDSVTQTVFSMNLTIQAARLLLGKDQERVTGQLKRLEELAASAMGEIQVLLTELRPHPVEVESLPTALRQLAVDFLRRHGLQASLEINGDRPLPQTAVIGLCRIAQEALNNVVKHSGTLQVTMRLDFSGEYLCFEIEDHGRGFDQQASTGQRGHLGLASMVERAHELGWELTFESHPGQGTIIRVANQNHI